MLMLSQRSGRRTCPGSTFLLCFHDLRAWCRETWPCSTTESLNLASPWAAWDWLLVLPHSCLRVATRCSERHLLPGLSSEKRKHFPRPASPVSLRGDACCLFLAFVARRQELGAMDLGRLLARLVCLAACREVESPGKPDMESAQESLHKWLY